MVMGKRVRLALVVAAALFFVSIFTPYWIMAMTAPPYPNQTLKVFIYGDRLEGDVVEWHRVSRLVGVNIPPPIPELDLKIIPAVMIVLAALSLLAALTRKRAVCLSACVLAWVVTAGMLGLLQYRLYVVGHDLDTTAPLRFFVKGGFTPPAIGTYTLGSISTYHIPYVGAVLTLAAVLLLTAAAFHPQIGRLRRKMLRGPSMAPEQPESAT